MWVAGTMNNPDILACLTMDQVFFTRTQLREQAEN